MLVNSGGNIQFKYKNNGEDISRRIKHIDSNLYFFYIWLILYSKLLGWHSLQMALVSVEYYRLHMFSKYHNLPQHFTNNFSHTIHFVLHSAVTLHLRFDSNIYYYVKLVSPPVKIHTEVHLKQTQKTVQIDSCKSCV